MGNQGPARTWEVSKSRRGLKSIGTAHYKARPGDIVMVYPGEYKHDLACRPGVDTICHGQVILVGNLTVPKDSTVQGMHVIGDVNNLGQCVDVTCSGTWTGVPSESSTGQSVLSSNVITYGEGLNYETLADALDAAESGQTVLMSEDYEGDITIPTGVTIVALRDGLTITGDLTCNGSLDETIRVIGTISGTGWYVTTPTYHARNAAEIQAAINRGAEANGALVSEGCTGCKITFSGVPANGETLQIWATNISWTFVFSDTNPGTLPEFTYWWDTSGLSTAADSATAVSAWLDDEFAQWGSICSMLDASRSGTDPYLTITTTNHNSDLIGVAGDDSIAISDHENPSGWVYNGGTHDPFVVEVAPGTHRLAEALVLVPGCTLSGDGVTILGDVGVSNTSTRSYYIAGPSIEGVCAGQIAICSGGTEWGVPKLASVTINASVSFIAIPTGTVGNNISVTIAGGPSKSWAATVSGSAITYQLATGPAKAGTIDANTDTITSNGHGYTNNQIVMLESSIGGLLAGTPYWVINATTNTFQLASTYNGSAFNVTASGSVSVYAISTSLSTFVANSVTGKPGELVRCYQVVGNTYPKLGTYQLSGGANANVFRCDITPDTGDRRVGIEIDAASGIQILGRVAGGHTMVNSLLPHGDNTIYDHPLPRPRYSDRPLLCLHFDDARASLGQARAALGGLTPIEYACVRGVPLSLGVVPYYCDMQTSLTWSAIRSALQTAGGEVFCHTYTHSTQHPGMPDGADWQYYETVEAADRIEQETGFPVRAMAWAGVAPNPQWYDYATCLRGTWIGALTRRRFLAHRSPGFLGNLGLSENAGPGSFPVMSRYPLSCTINAGGHYSGTTISNISCTASTDILTKSGHGLAAGDVLAFTGSGGGLTAYTQLYYVINVSGNDFQLSTELGGTPVDITSDGTNTAWKITNAVAYTDWLLRTLTSTPNACAAPWFHGVSDAGGDTYEMNSVAFRYLIDRVGEAIKNNQVRMATLAEIAYYQPGTSTELIFNGGFEIASRGNIYWTMPSGQAIPVGAYNVGSLVNQLAPVLGTGSSVAISNTMARTGLQSLQLTKGSGECGMRWQYIYMVPGELYCLRLYAKSEQVRTNGLQVMVSYGGALNSDCASVTRQFTVGTDWTPIVWHLVAPSAVNLQCHIRIDSMTSAGPIWVDDLSLT